MINAKGEVLGDTGDARCVCSAKAEPAVLVGVMAPVAILSSRFMSRRRRRCACRQASALALRKGSELQLPKTTASFLAGSPKQFGAARRVTCYSSLALRNGSELRAVRPPVVLAGPWPGVAPRWPSGKVRRRRWRCRSGGSRGARNGRGHKQRRAEGTRKGA